MTTHDTLSSTSASMTLDIIGTIESCYPDKFGIPRQPGLAPSATALLRFNAPFDHPDCVRGLEQFSHLWISFLFHQSPERWTPLIRPPRLGGNARVGVFASRSTHRPNRLGLSLVELVGIEYTPSLTLILRGHDLVDATPVVDIKPYLPWADSADNVRAGFAPAPPSSLRVELSHECRQTLNERADGEHLATLIGEVLAQDPRPAYRRNKHDDRCYGVRLFDLDVRFHVDTSSHNHESIIVVDRLVQMT
ncbi:tRNA (N6-threonylcarbamoyladenosine(37)-N6)-methyltransferase TrmO [Kushneria marisflavi]|uniref:tRNA (N6-threonylcarbamoyladenosine(37)-N6)-methyltransferase TrmO n=1 Tax=Kushneria marisflavi TaxID=157779 RepID=A0A240UMG9_9GAMM|nr:tRNA (N6-threonylcarbamoyladenosine(37)-N6)-methyltransferase TrmO [Kushneria marisflavi]ART62220.1 tRNA (N6-threonylcarbamoyladenosine(37)-N6)-methyltransferase TrmO [Kushneria marisflavi]RKD87305.1 tRNA-Thr(GGU) m(6)t(6)A37 methyltransferase TsaA [Kushneria marisflavi]